MHLHSLFFFINYYYHFLLCFNFKNRFEVESWEVDEHNGMAHWSYGGTKGNKSGLERSGSEIHCRTVNDTTIEGKEWPKEDDQVGW